jgi:hypothetical protein
MSKIDFVSAYFDKLEGTTKDSAVSSSQKSKTQKFEESFFRAPPREWKWRELWSSVFDEKRLEQSF